MEKAERPIAEMSLCEKLVAIRSEVEYLKKESTGYQFKYNSSSQVLMSVRANMDKYNVLLKPEVVGREAHREVQVKVDKGETKESVSYFTELDMEFTWINASSPGDTMTCRWYGQGIDQGEKGVGKAMTYAEKYFMLKFFNIATDKDDPDSFQGNGNGKNKPVNKPAPKATPAKPASPTGMITPKQQSKIHAMMNELGWEREEMISVARERFGVESSKDLTVKQAGEIIDMLQENLDAIPSALKEAVGNG